MKACSVIACLLATLLGFATPGLLAQGTGHASVVIEYFDDASQVKIKDADGFELANLHIGMQLLAGETIETANSGVEVRLDPNNSIIRIGPGTRFKINNLPSSTSNEHGFALLAGKIRAVAARSAGTSYRFTTPTAAGGVRGTDFGLEVVEGKRDRLLVKSGSVDFVDQKSGKKVQVGAGQYADTFAQEFAALDLSTQELADFFGSMEFVTLSPEQVPGGTSETPQNPEPATSANPAPASSPAPLDSTTASSPEPQAASPASPGTMPTKDLPAVAKPEPVPVPPGPDDVALLEDIKKFLGLEIGSVSIDGSMYGKLVLSPKIDLGDFRLGLYLPVIYTNSILDPSGWYRPNGNDEWSFGTDQGSDTLTIVADLLQDLALKIKYLELFDQRDPFFLGLGSLPAMTLGHGILLDDYANDTDFPAVRRNGFQLGLDLGSFAVEFLANDIAAPEIMGTRMLLRPLHPAFKLGAAISMTADFNPLADLPESVSDATLQTRIDTARNVNPYLFGVAADIDLPLLEGDVFSLLLYADIGGMIPYLNAPLARSGMDALPVGFYWSNLVALDTENLVELHNYGVIAGIMGKLFIADYRLEFQTSNGTFQARYLAEDYGRTRGLKTLDLISMLQGTDSSLYDNQKYGIHGAMGLDILDLVKVELSYTWPWTVGSGTALDFINQTNPDEIALSVSLNEELIPYGIDASIEFRRSHFRELFDETSGYSLLDTWATFTGSVDVPVGSLFKIRATVGTALVRDAAGNIDYSSGVPQVKPTFTLETVF